MPDISFHAVKRAACDLFVKLLDHRPVSLFTPVIVFQGITGLIVQIVRHVILHGDKRFCQFIQVQISLINRIKAVGHTVDPTEQHHVHHHHQKVCDNIDTADLKLEGGTLQPTFVHRPHPPSSDTALRSVCL